MKTKEEILKSHLDKNGIEITKKFVGYLYEAMEEYANLKVQSALGEQGNVLVAEKKFLKALKEEIDTAHFGEGIGFNLSQISDRIEFRLKQLRKKKPLPPPLIK